VLEVTTVTPEHTTSLVWQCLESVRKQKSVKIKDMIVVSQHRIPFGDGTLPLYVEDKPPQSWPAFKRNWGAKHATTKYIAFIDDDVELSPYCIYEMCKYLEDHPEVGMVYAKLLNMERRTEFDEVGSYLTSTGFLWSRGDGEIDRGQYDLPIPILGGKGAAMAVRTKEFSTLGGFDEDFGFLGEESDLSWRYWLTGKEVHYVPSSVAWHAFNTSLKPFDRHYTARLIYYNGARNYIAMLAKNMTALRFFLTLPIHLTVWLISGTAQLLARRPKALMYILQGFAYVWTHRKGIMAKRRVVQAKRAWPEKRINQKVLRNPPWWWYPKHLMEYVKTGLHG